MSRVKKNGKGKMLMTLGVGILAYLHACTFAYGDQARNIAFQRAVYQSSAADNTHVGCLVTDGKVADAPLLRPVVKSEFPEKSPNAEIPLMAVDGNRDTKWLVFESKCWLEVALPAPARAASYAIMSANDDPKRDPQKWRVLASNDGATFEEIAAGENPGFANRHERKSWKIDKPGTYRFYRLAIGANGGAIAENKPCTQLAEFDLLDDAGNSIVQGYSGDSQSRWISKTGVNEWLKIDLDVPSRVDSVSVRWAKGGDAASWHLELSADGKSWTRGSSGTDVRFVKLVCEKANGDVFGVDEIEVSGDNSRKVAAPAVDFREGWRFKRDGGEWQVVSIPHDDAIRHNFDVRRFGSSCGALPYFGKAEYEKTFTVSADEWKRLKSGKDSWRLEFDGIMSGSSVAVNGKTVYSRPCGYASFVVPLDGLLKEGGNALSVSIDANAQSSRWYPGFGIYRDARLVKRPADHVVPGSVAIWTENVTADSATVKVTWEMSKSGKQEKTFTVEKPEVWSPETPRLYTVEISGETFRYGIRTLRFDKTEGFFLNGKHRQMRGVCLHHDLGVFGAEFEVEAARRQLSLLKEMGCDAIRTAHNFPAPGLLDLCDEMGFMVMDEAFDEWRTPKVKHGMAALWDEWHEREIVDFVRRDRNHPCVVMWSAGNELPEDGMPSHTSMGIETARELTQLFHANDPENRPVTAGHWMPQTIKNGIGEATDVFGANYLPKRYAEFKGRQGIIGTETCSVVSSRGVYAFPIDNKRAVTNQVPSWDLCPMHPNDYIPDVEFAAQDANPHVYGEFVWTGFDYLGEPDPWRGNARSSYFGIFDLCGFPKDRYWIYKAKWCPDEPTAHILPHWNWKEGMKIPVHVYTSGDEAELFVNGVSLGRKRKGKGEYRLKWEDVPYAPGEVSVKTWKRGAEWAEDRRVTAGKFHHFEFTDKSWGEKYVFRTVMAVDEKGVFVPDAAVEVDVPTPEGCEIFGTCNGDAADLNSLRSPKVKTFSGMALVVYRRR